jgi:methylglutaconyl-CoA hydratase
MGKNAHKTVLVEIKEAVAWLSFNRPEVHNAFNAVVIQEMMEAVNRVNEDDSVRVVVLTGKGKSFCAGADLNWMREIVDYSYEQNLEESTALAEVLRMIFSLPKPTIAKVNGAAIGGGTGFLSACDIAVAAEEAVFGLSEVKIGLVPAAISPYVIRKIGESKAREYFLTGRRISAGRAREIGLVNEVVPGKELSKTVDNLIGLLLTSGPEAIASCKELIFNVPLMTMEEAKEYTAKMIAGLRISEEGQEGMAAFLEKRKPRWVRDRKK